MKEYWYDTQKGKVIRSMIRRWADNWYEDFELEKTWDIWIGNNVWPRLSQLLKAWVVIAEYFENPNKWNWYLWYKRARYKLTDEAKVFYRELYKEDTIREVLEHFEKPLWKRILHIN